MKEGVQVELPGPLLDDHHDAAQLLPGLGAVLQVVAPGSWLSRRAADGPAGVDLS